MIDAIVPARILREHPDGLPLKARPGSASLVRSSDNARFFRGDLVRVLQLEISLNDFGLETIYGRFLRDKIYSVASHGICGSFVDLYV